MRTLGAISAHSRPEVSFGEFGVAVTQLLCELKPTPVGLLQPRRCHPCPAVRLHLTCRCSALLPLAIGPRGRGCFAPTFVFTVLASFPPPITHPFAAARRLSRPFAAPFVTPAFCQLQCMHLSYLPGRCSWPTFCMQTAPRPVLYLTQAGRHAISLMLREKSRVF